MLNILVLCTGNSCRSILAEALLNQLGQGRVRAFSAGSHPTGQVNPNSLATLRRNGLASEGYQSQSWDEFAGQAFDVVITVCDQAAGEACPAYLGGVAKAHWGLPDPARATGTDQDIAQAFQTTYDVLAARVKRLLALPLETMASGELAERLNQIGMEVC